MRPWPIRPPVSIAGLTVGLLLSTTGAVQARRAVNLCPTANFTSGNLIVMAPVLQYTVTNFDPNWFNTTNSGASAPLFTLQILNSPMSQNMDSLAGLGLLRLYIHIDADTSLGRDPNSKIVALDEVTQPLTTQQIGIPLTSGQVFALPIESSGNPVTFVNSPLYSLVTAGHAVPQMNMHLNFALTCEDQVAMVQTTTLSFVPASLDAQLRQVNNIQALMPGTNISNPVPVVISTQYPIFQISSPLIDTMAFTAPAGESNVDVFIYEVPSGSSPQEVFDGQQFAQFPVSQNQVSYPPGLSQLVPGNVYAWRARGLLRGPESDYIYSNALYFQIDPRLAGGGSETDPGSVLTPLQTMEGQVKAGDDYGKRVLAALKIILGENYEMLNLSQTKMTPAQGAIRLNGRPLALEDLERLAREFQQSSNSVTRLRFQ